jgi:hypothetical protein
MCADGHLLVGDRDEAEDIRAEAQRIIDTGPTPLTEDERLQRRYELTDLLDDLRGCADPVECTFIAGQLLQMSGELALLNEGRWIGSGKWLARHLTEMTDNPAQILASALQTFVALGDKGPMIHAVSDILNQAGGPLTEGFAAKKPLT